ncbi:hypothetical protein [Methylobacterium iners]|uniref:Major facilitator superfamily (MFS) profile domain-containing protein n=1 Tax=Methylobacterium iners TaxID=418707 RepID=A0ABQ4S3I5_9HYPH|nr:hypothetical protein [Methylobacterium iners]GJD96255.1 hypothetical protein OCOJLMKI_3475 [Methylobacterium iners]
MITSALLFAAGIALGWRFGLWMILFTSGCLTAAYVALHLIPSAFGWLEFLILLAHLAALQGGFLLGQYLSQAGEKH